MAERPREALLVAPGLLLTAPALVALQERVALLGAHEMEVEGLILSEKRHSKAHRRDLD